MSSLISMMNYILITNVPQDCGVTCGKVPFYFPKISRIKSGPSRCHILPLVMLQQVNISQGQNLVVRVHEG